MIPMVEEYEWCWNLGAYSGQECELCPHRKECTRNKGIKNMVDCSNCEYYNSEEDVCMAMDCTPITDCTEPLPCEEKEESNERR